jgi:FMN phosphatase YigB (HAD superfamily)
MTMPRKKRTRCAAGQRVPLENTGKNNQRKTQPVKFVFTDMDSTLGLFWGYYCPAIRDYINEMHAKHGIAIVDLEREIGRVTQEFGTHEYGWMMEMTKFRKEFKGTAAEFRDQFVIPFWKHLDDNRHNYLRSFRDVTETLYALQQLGITVVIVSDAPHFMASTRACDMRLDGPVTGLFALDCPLPDVSSFVDPEDDGGVAQAVGMRFIWASYGLWVPPEYEDIIDRRITPSGELPTNGHGVGFRPQVYPPMEAEAVSYKTVLEHLRAEPLLTNPTKLNPSARPSITKGSGH